jgi:hypothetical protein
MKIAMLLAMLLVFACPFVGYAQNPVLKPGEAALYISEDGDHLSVVIVKIGLDGAQILEQRRMIKRNDEVQPNIIVCSISSLDSVMAGLNPSSSVNPNESIDSLTGTGTDLVASGESRITTKPLAVETARSKVEPRPRRAVKNIQIPKQVRSSVDNMAPKQTATVKKTEEPQPVPIPVPAETAGTTTGTQPAETPNPTPAVTKTDTVSPQLMIIIGLSLLILVLIVHAFRTQHYEPARVEVDPRINDETIDLVQEKLNDVTLKQQLEQFPVKSTKTAKTESVSEPLPPTPIADKPVAEEIFVPTIKDIESVSVETGKIVSLDTADLTESLEEPTAPPPIEPAQDGVLTIQASDLYLSQSLARLYVAKPLAEAYLAGINIAKNPDATTDDIDEFIKAMEHERIDNSLYFAGLKQITIGHPRTSMAVGEHNEHLVLKSGMKSWHVMHKLWERTQTESAVNKPEEGDLKIAVNHSYKQEE